MRLWQNITDAVQSYPFPELLLLLLASFTNNDDHIIERMHLTTLTKDTAIKLLEILSTKSTRNGSAIQFIKLYHRICSDLLIHRLIVQLVNFMIFFDGLMDTSCIFMILRQGLIVLPEQKLIFWRSLHWLYKIRLKIQA